MANRFWVLGGTDTIWESTAGATTNWATTSGGAAGASVPLITDAAIFDAASPNACTTGTGNVCVSLTTTNWTGTFTMTGSPVIGGSITFGVNTVFTGAGFLVPNTTGTLTFGGCGSRPNLNLRGSTTKTMADNWNVVNLDIGTTTENPTINGNTIDISGNLTPRITSGVIAGTTTLKMSGTGTWSMPNVTTGNLKNNLTFNTAGTITISGTIKYSTGTITYTAGTMVTTGSTLTIGTTSPTTPTYNTSGMTWDNVTLLGTLTYTITSDLNIGGTLSLGATTSIITINGLFNINVATLTMGFSSTGNVTGTASIVMNGTGTWSGTGIVKNNLTFNSAGTITVSGTVRKEANTLTYTAGTMSMGTSILLLPAATTLATNGMTWNDLQITTTSTITLSNACQTTSLTTAGTTTITINGAGITLGATNWVAGTTTLAGSANATFTAGTISGTAITLNGTGTYTFAGAITWTVVTFTRTAGTVTATGSTLTIAGSRTFAGATTWNNWDITGTATLTLNALQTLAGELDLQATTTFAGTNSWTANILNLSVAGLTHTLVSANTYTISASGQFIAAGTTGSHIALVASTAGTRAILTVTSGVSEGIDFLNGTDINSSLGQSVFTKQGVLSNDLNWIQFGGTVASSYVN